MDKFFQFIKRVWYGLPHPLQAALVVFSAAASSYLGESLSQGVSCFSAACIKHEIGAAIGAGVVALRAFYLRPGPGPDARTNQGIRRTEQSAPSPKPQ